MNIATIPSWIYLALLLVLLIIAGAAEFLGMLPGGRFAELFFLILGLMAPSPAFPHTTVQTPEANINAQKVNVQPPPSA